MEIDTLARKVITKNEIFADVVNYFLFDGKAEIKSDDLKELDTAFKDKVKDIDKQRFRDIYKEVVIKTDSKNTYLLVGIENQSKVDNRMLLRCLEYNIMSYYKQLDDIENKNKNVKIKLKPVITFVLYFGTKKWTGPKSLYEMLDLEFEEIKGFITNPKLYLISPNEIDENNINKFNSELRTILKYIKYSKRTELREVISKDDKFNEMSNDSVKLLSAVTKTKIKINEEEGVVNMCKAIDDMMKEAEAKGVEKNKIENAISFYKNGASLELISKSLGMSINKLKKILTQNNVELRMS